MPMIPGVETSNKTEYQGSDTTMPYERAVQLSTRGLSKHLALEQYVMQTRNEPVRGQH
jgi:hypothetical protein